MEQWIETLTLCCRSAGCRFDREEPMERHTTFRAGGPAQLMAHVTTAAQTAAVFKAAKAEKIPLAVLGRGSNLLVSDDGVRGLVLHLAPREEQPFRREGDLLIGWAGENLSALCLHALELGLSGLEFAYGIPGSLGGAVYMNAGAYGGEIKDCLAWVRFLDSDGQEQIWDADDLELSYRHSVFSGKDWIVLEAAFRLRPGAPAEIRAKMDDVMGRRRDKQPLEHPSAGSTFKRPEGAFASALIDQCGLKGLRVGGACVSKKHAGFIVNDQQGTCADIQELIRQVRQQVQEKTGYLLETEVEYWG